MIHRPPFWGFGVWRRIPCIMQSLPKTNSSPLKIGHPKWKLAFQLSIFRSYVIFREGKSPFRVPKTKKNTRPLWFFDQSWWFVGEVGNSEFFENLPLVKLSWFLGHLYSPIIGILYQEIIKGSACLKPLWFIANDMTPAQKIALS